MDKKNINQRRSERPNEEEGEHADKGGLKTETKSQGPKPDLATLPEDDQTDDESEDETDELISSSLR